MTDEAASCGMNIGHSSDCSCFWMSRCVCVCVWVREQLLRSPESKQLFGHLCPLAAAGSSRSAPDDWSENQADVADLGSDWPDSQTAPPPGTVSAAPSEVCGFPQAQAVVSPGERLSFSELFSHFLSGLEDDVILPDALSGIWKMLLRSAASLLTP